MLYAVSVPVFTFIALLKVEPVLKLKITLPCVCITPALGPDPETTAPLYRVNVPEVNVKVLEPGLKRPPETMVNELTGEKVTLLTSVIFPELPIVIVLLVYVPDPLTDVVESNSNVVTDTEPAFTRAAPLI